MLVEIVTFITAFSFANSQSFFPNPGRFSVTIEEIVPSAKEIRNVKVTRVCKFFFFSFIILIFMFIFIYFNFTLMQ